MKILCLDTSSSVLSLAIAEGKNILSNQEVIPTRRHSAEMFLILDRMLKKISVDISEIQMIAVGLGPGSFAGLRVGVTTAKTLAFTLRAKLIGFSSLDLIAYNARGTVKEICVMLDARRNKLYAAFYRFSGQGLKRIMKPALMTSEELLRKISKPTLFLGDGTLLCREKLEERFEESLSVGDPSLWIPRAANLIPLGHERIRERQFDDPFRLTPLYLYPRDCNVTVKSR